MAPSVGGAAPAERAPLSAPASPAEQALAELRRRIEAQSEDVGRDFAAEARRIHDGEAPARPIIGEARPAEARALIEDGIPVAPCPGRRGRRTSARPQRVGQRQHRRPHFQPLGAAQRRAPRRRRLPEDLGQGVERQRRPRPSAIAAASPSRRVRRPWRASLARAPSGPSAAGASTSSELPAPPRVSPRYRPRPRGAAPPAPLRPATATSSPATPTGC